MPASSPSLATGLLFALLSLSPAHAVDAVPADAGALAGLLATRGYDTIPLHRYGAAHLAVEVRINGVAGTFLIDTGAGRTVIDRARQARFADGRQADASGGLQATGAGAGNLAIETLPGSRLAIGDYRDDDFTAHFLALDHVTAAFSQRGLPTIDGVLGADVLDRGQAVIDYPNLRLHLRNPAAPAASVSH